MSFFHIFVHTDGHGEGFFGADKVSASVDSPNAACSKDVVIVPEKGVTARIFIPSAAIKTNQKLPLLLSRRRLIHGLTILFHLMKTWAALKWVASHFKISAHGYEAGQNTRANFTCVFTRGFNDVRIKPAADSGLRSLRCPRVLVCVTEKDNWRDGIV
ncbi:hypothetical protein WN943_024451 [Citrus x changshan-huyou]